MNKFNSLLNFRFKIILKNTLKVKLNSVKFDSIVYGGMSNITALYKVENKKYVCHMSTYGYDLFIKRDSEFKALSNLDKANFNLNQKPIYLSEKIRIFEYIEGTSLNTIKYQDYLKEISESFHKLHDSCDTLGTKFRGLDYLDEIKGMLVGRNFDEVFISSYEILKKNEKLLKSRKMVPCHNDLQPTNLVLNDGKVYILDFEYAMDNDYLYDIASFGNIDFNDSLELLKIYNKNYTEEDLFILKLHRIYINCLWYLTALKKEDLGYNKVLKMNFTDVALMFLYKNKEIIKSL